MFTTNANKEYVKQMYLREQELRKQHGLPPLTEEQLKEDYRIRQWLKIDNPDHKHQLITIALPNDLGINDLKKKIYSLQYAYLEGAMLRVENYSSTGENLHVHILKEGVYSKTRLIRDMKRKWKVEDNFVDVRLGKREDEWQNRLNYIKGLKQDEEKQANVAKDHEWRHTNGLQELYIL